MKKFTFISFFMTISFFASNAKAFFIYADTTKDNLLTKQEKDQGWKLLFDGTDMKGWRTYQNIKSNSWMIKNNSLYCKRDTSENTKHADLITDNEYENFELSIDWKIEPQSNSGILYMVTEQYEHSYQSGPEYQLLDDIGYPEKIENWQKTGANYAMDAPMINAVKPAGEWNHTVIIVNKGHVEHWLNGKEVVAYELWNDAWQQHKAAGKWKDEAGYGASKKGHIALQDHDGGVSFKNVKIKIL